jgi:hypothetical protein
MTESATAIATRSTASQQLTLAGRFTSMLYQRSHLDHFAIMLRSLYLDLSFRKFICGDESTQSRPQFIFFPFSSFCPPSRDVFPTG